MKALISFLVALIIAGSPVWTFCYGQDEPEVELIKFSWRKMQQAKPDSQKNTMEEILGNHNKRYDTRRLEPDEERQDEVKQTDTMGDDISKKAPAVTTKAYRYNLRIKNTGDRAITGIVWIYIFADPVSEKELLRHSFESKVKVDRGKEKQISVFSDDSPPNVVNANAQNNKAPWKETVIINEIKYSDGSVWKRP